MPSCHLNEWSKEEEDLPDKSQKERGSQKSE
jgi:hypothetical protein